MLYGATGGGDTGTDCAGTVVRQGARSVVQLELLSKPSAWENKWLTWPYCPVKLRVELVKAQAKTRRIYLQVECRGLGHLIAYHRSGEPSYR